MRTLVLLIATFLASASLIRGEIKTPENAPIEITSTGETTYENGLATARDNVAIHIGNTDIYADYAQYNPSTHDVELRGHVRIYRDTSLYIAENGIYNTETKKIRALNARTESQPYFLTGKHVTSISDNGYLSSWGPSLLTQVTFPITDDIKGRLRLDYRGRRGVAVGFDSTIDYFNDSQARLKTYYLQDQNPNLNETNIPRKDVPTGRYRV